MADAPLQVLTREQWGARPWDDKKGSSGPSIVKIEDRDEFFVHYDGARPIHDVGPDLAKRVESIHMDQRKWSGIGYNFLVDAAAGILEGRGWDRQAAACPDHNRSGIHVYVAVGGDQEPTLAQLAAVVRIYAEHTRRRALAGRDAPAKTYHGAHYATDCPGPALIAWVDAGMRLQDNAVPEPSKPSKPSKPAPKPPEKEDDMSKFPGTGFMQNGKESSAALTVGRALVAVGFKGYKVGPSKTWGPADTEGVRWYQKKIGNEVDGKLGPKQWDRLLKEAEAKEPSRPKDPGAGQWYVDTDTLNGRVSPSEKASLKWTRKRHADIDIVETKFAGNRWWGSSGSRGAWYAMEFLTKKKPTSKPKSNGTSKGYVRPIPLRKDTPITQGWDVKSGRYASGEHNGVDIAAPYGEKIRATIGGRVVRYGREGAYGDRLVIRGDDGLYWAYNHTSASLVRPGDRVETGQEVARIGTSGNVTGPHVCLEAYPSSSMRYNTDINPNRWP